MQIIMDLWDGSYRAFQAFARSPPHAMAAHMMAEQAVKDTVGRLAPIWRRTSCGSTASSRRRAAGRFADALDLDAKARFKAMGTSFLEHAEAAHLKWNGTTWTRSRHLLGTLCLKECRQMFASELLVLLGHWTPPSTLSSVSDLSQPTPSTR